MKSIYVFPEKKFLGLSPNFYIGVSVNDLYIPRSTYFSAAEMQTDGGNR